MIVFVVIELLVADFFRRKHHMLQKLKKERLNMRRSLGPITRNR
jgi:hypothetical protein